MRILFDQGTPAPLRLILAEHTVVTAFEQGWSTLKNGELLAAAEREGFESMVTTDRRLKYQQNLAIRKIGIIVLSTTSWPRIQAATDRVIAAVAAITPSAYIEVDIP